MSMDPKIKYPIGIQTFSTIIKEGYFYIDKTQLVWQLTQDSKYVFLSRPRRFGKSLLLSTLQSYFEGRRKLFAGLELERLEKDWIHYPVMRFDFSAAYYTEPRVLWDKLDSYLGEMEEEYGLHPAGQIADRFRKLIKTVCVERGQKVVILIDEYDKPMLETMHNGPLLESMKGLLRSFFSVLKESDEYIKFAMLTGVTKFGKVSVFSGLNNLTDISMEAAYNNICGITQAEFDTNFGPSLERFAQVNGITVQEASSQFKAYYDGYHFAAGGRDIYNPFSTLSAFRDGRLKAYWFATGSSSYLIKLIQRTHFYLQDLENVRRKETALSDITDMSRDIVPLFYQAGYLTVKGYNPRSQLYTLGFPNKEVSEAFWDSLGEYFFRSGRNMTQFDLYRFVDELEAGDIEAFMVRLKSMFASISNEHEPNKEAHFQNMLTIFVKMLGYCVRAEVHSSQGRSDIEIEAPRFIYILELKVDSTPEEAIAQIHNKGYAVQYETDPRPKIVVGANFSTTTRTLTGWLVERF